MLACCPVDYALNDITEMRQSKGLDWTDENVADPAPWVYYEEGTGYAQLDILVPEAYCAACIGSIERNYNKLESVKYVRLNLSKKRLSIKWDEKLNSARDMMVVLEWLGYHGQPYDKNTLDQAGSDAYQKKLLTALGVAGFAASNVMLLSVSVWAGAEESTKHFFHWISALIAIPAMLFSGRIFFESAFKALRNGQMNMDVPISLAVLLAAYVSLSETISGGSQAYFDASITLIFFLLAGRYLDISMRQRARSAAEQLMSMSATAATKIYEDGSRKSVKLSELEKGDVVFVAIGEKIPVDGKIIEGQSDIDTAFLTGESMPELVKLDDQVHAGSINLTGALTIEVTAVGKDTLLSDIITLMEEAERTDAKYVLLADRVAQLYAPAVHVLAAVTLIGWMLTGMGFNDALFIATAVLIITCPCALGLAVPTVQVVASGILLRLGILLKDGTALEKLADIDQVVFDKTGTLTKGKPVLLNQDAVSDEILKEAASLAIHSLHPLSKAIVNEAEKRGLDIPKRTNVIEHVGQGLELTQENGMVNKLGKLDFVDENQSTMLASNNTDIFFKMGDAELVQFEFIDELRDDAIKTIEKFKKNNIKLTILSGDQEGPVAHIAKELGIENHFSKQSPTDKLKYIQEQQENGSRIFVIGDGSNDAPALKAAHVSMSPGSATDVSQLSADLIFQAQSLFSSYQVWRLSRLSRSLVKQNIMLAIGYNILAVPIAIMGYASPFIAAIAMSTSSIIVTANAARLRLKEKQL